MIFIFSLVFVFDVLLYRLVCVTGPSEEEKPGPVVLKISGKYETQSAVFFDYVVSFNECSLMSFTIRRLMNILL